MTQKPIVSRSASIAIDINQKREGDYGAGTSIAKHTVTVELPASSKDIAATVKEALDMMSLTVQRFQGDIPSPESEATITSK